ncbi:hypothetical protein C0J52_25291, partial [Blattella germanica]
TVKRFTEIFKAVKRGLILEEYQRLVQNDEYAAKIREWMINHKMESGEYVYPSEEERNRILEETQRKKNYFHWSDASTKSLITIKREMEEDFNKPKMRKKKTLVCDQ